MEHNGSAFPLGPRRSRRTVHDFTRAHFKHGKCKPHAFTVVEGKYLCQCGRDATWEGHQLDHKHLEHKDTFDPKSHLKKSHSTDYGEIYFQGFGFGGETFNKPYIRVHKDTDPGHLWTLIRDYWKVPNPKLIISVTGGAKFFTMKPRLISTFKRGLINAATTTDAWIITGGTNAGVMEFVGEAIREHILTTGASSSKVVAMGIATWGIIDNKDHLSVKDDRQGGKYPAYYRYGDLSPKDTPLVSALDPNHSHFILVDDGTEKKFGVEITLRAKLERHISQTIRMSTDIHVPVVTLVLEGGENTIETATQAVKNRTPIVIIQGSGRAADVIAEAYWGTKGPDDETDFDEDFEDIVKANAREKMDIKKDDNLEKIVNNIKTLLQDRNMITVFRMGDDDGTSRDMEKTILYSLLKANREDPPTQLRLALAWDCSDMAQRELFRPENRSQWKNNTYLYDAMLTALVQNRSEFVHIFLDNGVDLGTFLTKANLEELYLKVVGDKYAGASAWLLKDLLEKPVNGEETIDSKSILSTVNSVVADLMGGVNGLLYEDRSISTEDLDKSMNKGQAYMHPERELFIWAVLLNRRELALSFWKSGKDHIGAALSACFLLQELVMQANKREELDLSQDLQNHADEFHAIAVGVLGECYQRDKEMSHQLLTRELDLWGNETLLSLSEGAELMDFMEHTCVQTKLNRIWMGRMAQYNSMWMILLGLIFPFMVMFIKFTSKETNTNRENSVSPEYDANGSPETDEEDLDTEYTSTAGKRIFTAKCCGSCRNNENQIGFIKALTFYYTTPLVKFCYHTISYIVFLGLFSYFMLIDFGIGPPGVIEIVVWCWAVTLIADEVRQAISSSGSVYRRLDEYFGDMWNRFDAVMYTMLIVSIILRFTLNEDNFNWARMLYTLTLTLFYLRFMQVFFVEKRIGPKVIMIRRMITDLSFFILILVVVIFAFGVAQQALLFPRAERSWEVLRAVVAEPYWNLYGELFLDELHGDIPDCSNNASEYRNDPDIVRCPEKSWLAILLNAIYLLLTNILLINLLIAMFSYTFQNVQDNSEKVWRFFRYGLVYEFFNKPALAPPLIIISHLWGLGRYLHRCCNKTHRTDDDFRKRCPSDVSQTLTAFERAGMENFLIRKQLLSNENIDSKVTTTREKIEQVISDLEHLREEVVQKQPLILEGGPPSNWQRTKTRLSLKAVRPPNDGVSALKSRMDKMEEVLYRIESQMRERHAQEQERILKTHVEHLNLKNVDG